MNKKHSDISKFLSYVLRHEPQAIGLTLDSEGWADIAALIVGSKHSEHELDVDLICAVVESSDKKRFAISEDGLRIRAVQGHSAKSVAITHVEKQPPEILYHGTASRFLDGIRRHGLRPQNRQYVHLSDNVETAMKVGQRHGKSVLLSIPAQSMHKIGHLFFQAENGVWLIKAVPAQFISGLIV